MATERQIAANRRNAQKSTGPRTAAGKRRAAGNARRHGLSIVIGSAADDEAVKSLALAILAGSSAPELLEAAYSAARAYLELAHIRQIKAELIQRVLEFGAVGPELVRARLAESRHLQALLWRQWQKPERLKPVSVPSEAERQAEVVRRLLPELRKLNRYEARTYARWDRALSEVVGLNRVREQP
ncbi:MULTISPECIES: hypothetical protein [Bradyrhizobium]|uniref:hypothetical protein n=1 Tax=Bradyrhizobium TaxID=374 RepID=UPI00155EDFAF|nr:MULTISPECIES: hypothetical protein [Bradyrhizobium]MDD1518395.1 hypothetical protein [Bradyrhizobium sp. WBAH30]MDD1542192.1 hypothetical protein [Bradyrhizobium sp. WBAH41]MDD1556344.1 hypothetical protein [Bradyrhizobium sp. WBAH23]MDD1561815.1 hypothetical protein [Bradyrhizobium sp. WBAH33]MDD1589164.1 hypothetical protein [Bradyrhizobium sp. WBAH42]